MTTPNYLVPAVDPVTHALPAAVEARYVLASTKGQLGGVAVLNSSGRVEDTTGTLPTTADLNLKIDKAGGTFTGPVVVPTPTAAGHPTTKAYVDANVIADATTTSKGNVQLAGDLAGTAAAPTVPGKASLSGATFTGPVIVPTPTLGTHAVTKAYADSLTGAGVATETATGSGAFTTSIVPTGRALVTVDSSTLALTTAESNGIASPLATSMANLWGWVPKYFYNGTTWPATRVVPAGYSGKVEWDSGGYPAAPEPPAAITGDRWIKQVS